MSPTVAVVIPTLDRAQTLRRCIESTLACDPTPDELIVVDCGSKDGTREVVESFAPRVRWLSSDRRSPAAARNLGFSATTADYVMFTDSDDESLPEKSAALAAHLSEHRRCAMVHGAIEVFGTDDKMDPIWTRRLKMAIADARERGTSYPALANTCTMYTSATMMRRSSVDAIGGYDEGLATYEDWDLYLRLSLVGSLDYVDTPSARYRIWEGNVSWAETAQGAIEVATKHLASLPDLPSHEARIARFGFLARLAASNHSLLRAHEARSAALRAATTAPLRSLMSHQVRRAAIGWLIPRSIRTERRAPSHGSMAP